MLTHLVTFFAVWTVAAAALGKTVVLNNGITMPTMAFGTLVEHYKKNDTRQAMINAYNNGVRHFDTSLICGTETDLGEAMQYLMVNGDAFGNEVSRGDCFITTKMTYGYTRETVPMALKRSLENLQMDYVDMYLVHLPHNAVKNEDFDVVDVWKGMEDVLKMGWTKTIGLCNHNSTHINKIMIEAEIMPAVNQIEVNPSNPNLELVAYCQSQDIVVIGYAAHGDSVERPHHQSSSPCLSFDDPTLIDIANFYGKSTNQVILRYLLDRDVAALVKAFTLEHIVDNMNVYDFSLSDCEVLKMNDYKCDPTYDQSSKPGTFDFTSYFFNMTADEAYEAMGLQ